MLSPSAGTNHHVISAAADRHCAVSWLTLPLQVLACAGPRAAILRRAKTGETAVDGRGRSCFSSMMLTLDTAGEELGFHADTPAHCDTSDTLWHPVMVLVAGLGILNLFERLVVGSAESECKKEQTIYPGRPIFWGRSITLERHTQYLRCRTEDCAWCNAFRRSIFEATQGKTSQGKFRSGSAVTVEKSWYASTF